MSKSQVYFVGLRARRPGESLLNKVQRLFDRAGLGEIISPADLVGVKIHFGEKGNTSYLRPIYIRQIVDKIKARGGKPFVVDSNTLYVGSRSNAVDHLETAISNGFDYSVIGAPLIIADGLRGKDFREVEVGLKHFERVKLSSNLLAADGIIVASHVKGHAVCGFGGAIKNLAMGGASRGGKQMMHSSLLPEVKESCIGCGICIPWCPGGAISVESKRAVISKEKCIGCGECPVNCPNNAVEIQWDDPVRHVMERMVEFVHGYHKEKPGKIGYVNFLMDISPDCDCFGWSDAPIVPDIGILASCDPVAIDQASIDLIRNAPGLAGTALDSHQRPGEEKFSGVHKGVDPEVTMAYAEEIGLGNRQYDLIEVK